MYHVTMTAPLILASNNPGKIAEFRGLLQDCGWPIVVPADMGLALDVDETGQSYAENALLKARAFVSASGSFCLADDSGLEVDALDGVPGIQSARFGGPELTDEQRVELLLDRLKGIADGRRTARFRCVLMLAAPDGRTWQTEAACEGQIARAPRGGKGFGYDPVFFLPGLGRTMAELSADEKNRVSHRSMAAAALRPILARLLDLLPVG